MIFVFVAVALLNSVGVVLNENKKKNITTVIFIAYLKPTIYNSRVLTYIYTRPCIQIHCKTNSFGG